MIRKLLTSIDTNFQKLLFSVTHWHVAIPNNGNMEHLGNIWQKWLEDQPPPPDDPEIPPECLSSSPGRHGVSQSRVIMVHESFTGRQTIVTEWSHWLAKQHGLHIPQGACTVGLSQSKIINNDCDKYISLILTLLSHSPCRGALCYAAQSKPRSKAPIYTAGCLRQ